MPAVDPLAIVVVVLIAVLLLSIRLSYMMARRAICTVIQIFRDHEALSFHSAKTLKELKLVYRPFTTFLRDYKPFALQVLINEGIIQVTFDDRFFLAEENLARANNLRCPVRIMRKVARSYNPFSPRSAEISKNYSVEGRTRS